MLPVAFPPGVQKDVVFSVPYADDYWEKVREWSDHGKGFHRARRPSARPGLGHDRGARTGAGWTAGAHAPLSDTGALSSERRELSQAARLSRLMGG
jgi:hypothetical protein